MRGADLIVLATALAAMGCGERSHVESPAEAEEPRPEREEVVVQEGAAVEEPPESPEIEEGEFAKDWKVLDRIGASTAPQEWGELLASATADPFLTQAILRRWAEVDPVRCWRGLIDSYDGEIVDAHLRAVVDAWAPSDPEQAIEALLKWDGERVDGLLGSVLNTALNTDFERGAKLLKPAIEKGARLTSNYSPAPWMEADPARACRMLAALPKSRARQYGTATGAAAAAWYRKDPKAALGWSIGLPRNLRTPVVNVLTYELLESGDTEWLTKLHDALGGQVERERVGQTLFRHLLEKDLATACQWAIEQSEAEELSRCFGVAMNHKRSSGGSDDADNFSPATFLPFFEQMPEGRGKGLNARTMHRNWSKSDPVRASDWMAKLHPLSYRYVGSDTSATWASRPEARPWVGTAPDSPFTDDTLKSMVRMMSAEDLRVFASALPEARANAARRFWESLANGRR